MKRTAVAKSIRRLAWFAVPAALLVPMAGLTVLSGAQVASASTFTISGSMEGNLPINPGDAIRAGYDFTIPGGPPAADTVTVSDASVVVFAQCPNGTSPELTIALPTQSYTVPQGDGGDWFPSGDQQSSLVYQGSLAVPSNFCGGQQGHAPKGATFTASFTATTSTSINVRMHYSDNTSGSWSGTASVTPPQSGQTIAGHIYLCSNGSQTSTEVPGGTLSATGPQTIPAQPNPLNPTPVAAGTYTMAATSPSGYQLVACGSTPASPTQTVVVPTNGAGVGIFYVSRANVCPTGSAFGPASSYNEFAFGNVSRGKSTASDVEGNAAYGGNANLNDMYYGDATGAPDALVVGGNVSVNGYLHLLNGSTGVYGGTINQTVPGMSHGAPPFSFAAVQSHLTSESALWGIDSTTTGDSITMTGQNLFLFGYNSTLNVFDLPQGEFGPSQTIWINVPVGSTTLINVPDNNISSSYSDVQYWDGSQWETGAQTNSAAVNEVRDATLFNFPNAGNLQMQDALFAGSILAPRANFQMNGSDFAGNLVANQINGDYQSQYEPPFTGCQS